MAKSESTGMRVERELREIIHEAHAAAAPILPSLSQLIQRLGASRATVLKVLHRLRDAGFIVNMPRRGYVITDLLPSPSPPRLAPTDPDRAPHPCRFRWQEVVQALERDVFHGRFSAGSGLPSAKELRARYGCGHPALRRALVALRNDGLLVRHGRGYRVRSIVAPQSAATIGLVAFTGHVDHLCKIGPHAAELWRTVEQECGRRHLQVEACSYEKMIADPALQSATPVGYLFSSLSNNEAWAAEALRATLSARLPVALLNEGRCGDVLYRTCASPLLRSFAVGTSQGAGRRVGEYLLARGHRRVLFLVAHDRDQERKRWAGVCRAYERAGLEDAVVFRVAEFGRVNVADPAVAALHAGVGDAVGTYARRVGIRHDDADARRFAHQQAVKLQARARLQSCFDPLFDSHIATAWVAFNDELALQALDYLEPRGVDLPRRMSLIGFDDTVEGFARGLSSYSFNIPAIVNAVLDHILAPKRSGRRTPVVEIPGMVLERRTSGTASAQCRERGPRSHG
jgi:DNA-binding FadR family transcriptional regulator